MLHSCAELSLMNILTTRSLTLFPEPLRKCSPLEMEGKRLGLSETECKIEVTAELFLDCSQVSFPQGLCLSTMRELEY